MKNIITNIDSRSPLAESIKTLRTNLQFMKTTKGLQTILVTSTLPSEGKSWVSSNLAVAFAQTGKRTILIDSDMRKGTAHFIFDLPLTPGLSNFLSGVNVENEDDIRSVMQPTEIENLHVITAGDIPPNPSELMLSDRMKELFSKLSEVADVVIFDGTPSILVTDAIILSRMVNSTVIVAEYNKTKMNNLKQVKEDIEKVGGKVAGVILNKIPTKAQKYGYGYGYGYGYTSYGYSVLPAVVKENKFLAFFKKIGEVIKSGFNSLCNAFKNLGAGVKEKAETIQPREQKQDKELMNNIEEIQEEIEREREIERELNRIEKQDDKKLRTIKKVRYQMKKV